MDLTRMPLFKMAYTRMEWAAQRHRVLAQNVGQVDTPDYRPRDLKPLDFRTLARQAAEPKVSVAMTNPAHSPGTLPEPDPFRTREQTRSFETTLDGNTVVLEEQMQKIGETKSRYMMAANLFERSKTMLRSALGKQ